MEVSKFLQFSVKTVKYQQTDTTSIQNGGRLSVYEHPYKYVHTILALVIFAFSSTMPTVIYLKTVLRKEL